MKKRLLSAALTLVMLTALIPAAVPAVSAGFTPVTGWDMMAKLGVGINIGNTMEARGEIGQKLGLESELQWGNPYIEQWNFKAIKQKGFDSVRIPVTWSTHMDGNYNIDKAWMDRVQQCVDWALAEGLYVVINTHHEDDGLYQFMGKNEDHAEAKKWLTAVWAQIAERFKEYPETLIFEPMNEPRPDGNGWYWDYINYPEQAEGMKRLVALTNRLNHDALELIRKSGGNNDRRVVMLTMPQGDANLIDQYQPPDDPHTMLGVFIYPEGRGFDSRSADKNIAKVKAALDQKIPMVIKETNPLEVTDPANVLEWGRHTYGELAKLNVPSQWWNCAGTGPEELFDRSAGKWNKPVTDMFFAAYGRTPGADYAVPPPPLPCVLKGPYADGTYTFWTPPARELAFAEKMVVEHEGEFGGGYSFTRFSSEWAQFDNGDSRITAEPGKLTFDLRGLEGTQVGFGAWAPGDAAKIKRVYIDTWAGTAAAPNSLSNFTRVQPYDNRFTDLNWSGTWVSKAYEYGIIAGTSSTTYGSNDNMTIQNALVIASKMHGIYHTGDYDYDTYGSYPNGYITYALENSIIDDRFAGRYTDNATRAELAYMWSRILPRSELQGINTYNPVSDVATTHEHYDAIKLFYEAGIVSGSDTGLFNPDSPASRGDCAVMFVRLVNPSDRSGAK